MKKLTEQQLNKMSLKNRQKYWKRLTKQIGNGGVYGYGGKVGGSFSSKNR